MSDKEAAWISTEGNIKGAWHRAHIAYRNIQNEALRILTEHDLIGENPEHAPDRRAFDHVAACNYFGRPGREGESIKESLGQQDIEVAEQRLRSILDTLHPDRVTVASRLGWAVCGANPQRVRSALHHHPPSGNFLVEQSSQELGGCNRKGSFLQVSEGPLAEPIGLD